MCKLSADVAQVPQAIQVAPCTTAAIAHADIGMHKTLRMSGVHLSICTTLPER
jgi:hypothetical protein